MTNVKTIPYRRTVNKENDCSLSNGNHVVEKGTFRQITESLSNRLRKAYMIKDDVPGLIGMIPDTDYLVTSEGKVYSLKSRKIMSTFRNRYGSEALAIYIGGIQYTKIISKLIADAFIYRHADARTVKHLNGDRMDNRAANLEWYVNPRRAAGYI